ncbi:hypothetical protein QBC47DRAFT_380214 [Echria macrotheca]|uniref:Infection structure specific protein n=1 Tax=Echria macrotheca TaxID=438768 RepID=A0AAJ0BEW1_9PEZI|nr:hypothetical protein QBC47DRAFT_380214 [Echria macrotheca]
MKLLNDVLIIAAFGASAATAAVATTATTATTTSPPGAAITRMCVSKYQSLRADYPEDQNLVPWLSSEVTSLLGILTATNVCDLEDFVRTATPPPSLSSDWSKQLSMASSWMSQKSPEIASLVSSSCSEFGFLFEGFTVTDKAGCESLERKYGSGMLGTVGSVGPTSEGTGSTDGPLLVPATSTPSSSPTTSTTITVSGAASSSKSGNGVAGPRETGALVGAAAAALVGAMALM